jgi:regulator of sirC expression with transglutaminase-like and TPR domain
MNQNEIKALVSLLEDDDTEIVDHVTHKITSLGEVAIPFLEAFWEKNYNPQLQGRLENLMQSMQFRMVASRLTLWYESPKQDLLEAMWIIATYQYPRLQKETLEAAISQIYYDAWLDFRDDLHPIDQVKLLNDILFKRNGFKGNTKDFHSPKNSMLNHVLRTKKGNPISLCIIYMLLAQRLNVPIYGVSLPNLFILTYKSEHLQFYINAFYKGMIFTRQDIDNYIAQLNLTQQPLYYEPCDNLHIVQRVLKNLVAAYEKDQQVEKVEDMKRLLEIVHCNW